MWKAILNFKLPVLNVSRERLTALKVGNVHVTLHWVWPSNDDSLYVLC